MWEPIVQGKTIMITGGTAGIGLVAARELAAKGAAVVIVGRDAAKGSRAVADIGRQTGNDRVHFVRADLSSQAEVRRVARDFVEGYPTLDVLVNNAGALFTERPLRSEERRGGKEVVITCHTRWALVH